jgi:hypothetical protein
LGNLFKKYNWFNRELEGKYKTTSYIVYVLAVAAILTLLFLSSNIKWISYIIAAGWVYAMYRGSQIKNQDKQLKIDAWEKKQNSVKVGNAIRKNNNEEVKN